MRQLPSEAALEGIIFHEERTRPGRFGNIYFRLNGLRTTIGVDV